MVAAGAAGAAGAPDAAGAEGSWALALNSKADLLDTGCPSFIQDEHHGVVGGVLIRPDEDPDVFVLIIKKASKKNMMSIRGMISIRALLIATGVLLWLPCIAWTTFQPRGASCASNFSKRGSFRSGSQAGLVLRSP